jgi:hypothetical protein
VLAVKDEYDGPDGKITKAKAAIVAAQDEAKQQDRRRASA